MDISNVDSDGNWVASDPMHFGVAPSRARRVVAEGDVLVSTVRTYLRAIAHIDRVDEPLICSTGFVVLSANGAMASQFLAYWARSVHFVDEVVARSVGVSYPAVNAPDIGNIPCPVLPIDEQRAIAAFLNRETARIDVLIGKKRRQIELLHEKRSALISHAVTKGLDPNAPMKGAGIDWLGPVPAHWDVWKATHAFERISSGTTPKSDNLDYYDGDIPWVTTSELRESVIEDTQSKLTGAAIRDYSGLRLYPAGTLLFALYGATIGRMGILGIPATVNQACAAFVGPKHLTAKFTYYWLWMRRPTLIVMSAGGGQPNLGQDDLREVRVPAPPVDEQEAIVEWIESELGRINPLVDRITASIEVLREYRTALISAAVTGKLDVRQEVA